MLAPKSSSLASTFDVARAQVRAVFLKLIGVCRFALPNHTTRVSAKMNPSHWAAGYAAGDRVGY